MNLSFFTTRRSGKSIPTDIYICFLTSNRSCTLISVSVCKTETEMGTYTTNYNLFMPTVGESGWGELVNGNFATIDTTMKGLNTRIGTLETETDIMKDELNGIKTGEVSLPNLDVVTLTADNINGKLLVNVTTAINSTHYVPIATVPFTNCSSPGNSWGDYTTTPFYCSGLFNITNTSTEVTVTFGYGTGTNTSGNGGYAEIVTSSGESLLYLNNVRFGQYYNNTSTFTTTIAELMAGIKFRTMDNDANWNMRGQISEIIFYA